MRGNIFKTVLARCFAGAAILACFAVAAQPAAKTYRIGMLERTSAADNAANLDAFRQGMRALAYIEGKHYVIDYRSVEGRNERYAEVTNDLLRLKADVILARGTAATLAAKNGGSIPVVMTGIGDPVAIGAVLSLARPGGHVTGLTAYTRELYAKRVELLKELLPASSRIAALYNMSEPNAGIEWQQIESAAHALRLQAQVLDVRKPEDLQSAFAAASNQRVDALIVPLLAVTQANHRTIVDLAARYRLPVIYASASEFPGGLISHGVDYPDLYRRAASYVDRILKGANAGELPVEQPTKFELVINMKTAKALGVAIPSSLALRADRLIEQ